MRYRNFCFTLNNYTEDQISALLTKLKTQYIVFAKEIGESGTPHLQGYVELPNQLGRDQIKDILGFSIHIEHRVGTQAQAIAYVKTPEETRHKDKKSNPKEEDLYESGEPKRQGQRHDLDIAREWLYQGKPLDPQDPDFTIGVQKAYEKLQPLIQTNLDHSKPRVTWYYGKGGSGKTARAYSECDTIPYKCDLLQHGWLDGYNGHANVIIDDLTVNETNEEKIFDMLLKMFDRYPLRMNVKGSSCWFRPNNIIVTSQEPPYNLFGSWPGKFSNKPSDWLKDVKLRQLMRRIDFLREMELEHEEDLIFPIEEKIITQKS